MKHATQISKIRTALEAGESITTFDAIIRWRCTRLAAHICILKKRGMKISKQTVVQNGKRFARYMFEQA